jgi:C-methyltransferase C-terminal domain/Putative zinc binding domain
MPPTTDAFAGFHCRSCGAPEPPLVVDLGQVPASDQFPRADDPRPDSTWPLTLHMCRECALVQLGPGRGAFPEPQAAVDSATAVEHAATSVAAVVAAEGLRPDQSVIELDSSHGASWLPRFLDVGLVPVPGNEQADLVVDVHYLMHEEDLDAVVAAHAIRLAPGGRLVCEFFHVLPLVQNTLIDTIRHGHFVYLSVLAAQPLFARNGLTITRAEMVDVYGGSVRLTAARTADDPAVDHSVDAVLAAERAAGLERVETLEGLGSRGRQVAGAFRAHLVTLAAQGRRVAGYGAPSKAAVLLALSDVDEALLPYTVDLSPAKDGRRIPGAGVPIRSIATLLEDRPDEVVILTWDIAEEVVGQLARMSAGSGWAPRLFAPLPVARDFLLEGARTGHSGSGSGR